MALKSKTALLELKADFGAASTGEEILEQKRNIILKEILSMVDEVQSLRERVDEAVQKSYRLLIKAFMQSGRERVGRMSSMVRFEAKLEVKKRSFIGIVVPEVNVQNRAPLEPVAYTGESLYLDLARVSFAESLDLILKLSTMEIKIWRLAEELKKTVVRVNALKNYYIPRYRKEIKSIESSLEESEREFLTILKILTKEK